MGIHFVCLLSIDSLCSWLSHHLGTFSVYVDVNVGLIVTIKMGKNTVISLGNRTCSTSCNITIEFSYQCHFLCGDGIYLSMAAIIFILFIFIYIPLLYILCFLHHILLLWRWLWQVFKTKLACADNFQHIEYL